MSALSMSERIPCMTGDRARKRAPLTLRSLDPGYCAKARELRLGAGYRTRLARLDGSRLYVHLDTLFLGRPQAAYWCADDLCQLLFGDERLPPDRIDPPFMARIADDVLSDPEFDFGIEALHVQRVCGAVRGQVCQEYLFERETECGKLYLSTLEPRSPWTDAARSCNLPVPLSWRVGRTSLDSMQLGRLRHGDVIRVSEWRPIVLAASLALMTFTFDGETAVIEAPFDESDDDFPQPHFAPARLDDAPIALERIPVSCEFVLPMREFKLDELSMLEPGAVLPLERAALSAVEMRVGRHCVALGELVQIGDEVGFEVSRLLLK